MQKPAMNGEANAAFWCQRKLVTLEGGEKWGNVSRASFYRWKKRFEDRVAKG